LELEERAAIIKVASEDMLAYSTLREKKINENEEDP